MMNQDSGEAIALRTAVRANPRIEIELKGQISEVLMRHGVEISNSLLADLVLAVEEELGVTPSVGLPRPQLPPP